MGRELFDPAKPSWDAPRSAGSVALLCELAAEHGVDPARCLRASRIDAASLTDPEAEITAAQELRLIEQLVAAVGDAEGLGLEAGSRYRLTTYGIWGIAVVASKTARDAVAVAMQFVDLTYALTSITARETARELEVDFGDLAVAEPVRRFALERDTLAAVTIWRELLEEPVTPLRVELRLPAPRRPERFESAYGMLPAFGAQRTVIAYDAKLLDRPLPRAAPLTANVFAAQCHELLQLRQARQGTSGRVRKELLMDPRRTPSQEEVAAALHVSCRTLRRRLADEGTTFRELAAQTRQLLAEELLSTGRLTVEQVAERVGYSEASSFIHAFTRWNGVAPRRWAKAHAQPRVRA